jgi:RadC-like JAB domain
MASEAQTLRSRSHLEAQVETLSRAVPFSERTPRYPRKTASVLMKTSQPWILLRSPRKSVLRKEKARGAGVYRWRSSPALDSARTRSWGCSPRGAWARSTAQVFGPAIVHKAAALLLFHNHPSGDPEPSPEDVSLTRRLIAGGSLLGIEVLDHIIVGDGSWRWISLKERGVL